MPKRSKKKNETQSSAPAENPLAKTKLFQNLLRITEQFMSGKSYLPLSFEELMQRLSLPIQHTDLFQEILNTLSKEGLVEVSRGRYALKKRADEIITGIIRMHPRGFGFVSAENTDQYKEDIFIPKPFTMNAVDGDKVEVQVNTESVSEKGPEGKVVSVLSRSRTHMAGIVRSVSPLGQILAYVPLLGLSQRVVVEPTKEIPLREGDRIVMEILDWGSKETETICKPTYHIGHISDPSCDIKAAIEEFEIRADFPSKVTKEAQTFGIQVSRKDIEDREDLRDQVCVTIDPDTAKDFDDAVSLTKDKNGHYHLGVHIADVSHYVKEGSTLDEEAMLRCNSTYFPGCCVPMLPPELSENLCSLKPEVNRLTASVFMHFDASGNLLNYRMARTVIRSAKRFTYREAKEVLDGKKKSKFAPLLDLMVELCKLLKVKRYERGSIEFALPELVVIVDEKGAPQKTDYIAYDVTHQMIEEFMLKANELVALHLSKIGKGVTYRVHDVPSEENMKDFSMLTGAFGYTLSENPTSKELQTMFDEALQTPYGQYLATSYIRRMRLAMYSPENIGHYGLGLTHYCHFTSPIRRYVDLVVHRTLFGEASEKETLEEIAKECSEQERISAKAENSVVMLKKLRLLDRMCQEDPYKQFEAIVTKVKNFGFYFEVIDLLIESYLHVSELESDYFTFEESGQKLTGRHTGTTYSAGQKITVMLKELDFIVLESKWYLVPEKAGKQTKPARPKGSKQSGPSESSKPSKPSRSSRSARPSKASGPGPKDAKKPFKFKGIPAKTRVLPKTKKMPAKARAPRKKKR